MQDQWQTFLTAAGATLQGGTVRCFTDVHREVHAAANTDIVADLSHLALIRAQGEDAQTFLQSQLTNDIRQLGANTQLSAYCSAQGRVLALLRIFRHDDAYLLQLPASLLEGTLKRLKMFVLRARVALTAADDLTHIGFSGPSVENRLRALIGALPEMVDSSATTQGVTVIRLPGPHPRFEIVGPTSTLANLWTGVGATPVGEPAWSWLDIRSGLPTVLPATTEVFVPQMMNLDLLNGISFTKGCYPGQEIVARTRYLGRLKQRMYAAHVADEAPASGGTLYAPNFGDQVAGTVVDAQPGPNGGYDLLAVIQIGSVDAGEVHLGRPDGPRLAFQPLPYSLDATR
jgi:folate-binding protein YgfZ